ncbi:MAG: Ribonuclease R [Bacteroidia bacterium]|nr:Ribonuclease R [Bacteroidia bacterium]
MSKNKKVNKPVDDSSFAKAITEALSKSSSRALNYKQIAKILNINDGPGRSKIAHTLNQMKLNGTVKEIDRGKFRVKAASSYFTGTVDMTSTGAGYVVSPQSDSDIYIAPKNLKNALHGDKVKVYVHAAKKGERLRGEIVEIVERAKTSFVGVVKISKNFAFLLPDNPKMPVDLYIPLNALNGARDGEKAIGKITDWPAGATNPFGEITEVLGMPGNNDTEMNAILAEYDFPLSFPKNVEADAEKIPDTISEYEIKKRRDFRDVTTFTIDPVDAKDFDDALSLRKLENGNYEIGVHIADVSHYVKPGSALDDEAIKRATSVYLVDRVIPMLPEKLSNMVCSLRPKEDKLCFSAVFEMNEDAKVLNQWFGRTIINSDRRFTYEEAQQVIETGEGNFADEINLLDRLAKKLRAERFKQGSIAFEKTEVKFHLDEKGNPTGVYVKEMKDSNKLIEDFMLLANRKVAEYVGKTEHGKKERTFVYRIHDNPSPEKLQQFVGFIGKFGYGMKTSSGKEIAFSMNRLMKDIHGKGEQNVIEQLAIRTMAKAVYTTENIGHYGLAFDYYTHFTSPIRRYPDVMVHRLLQHYLDGGPSVNEDEIEEQCEHSSAMEKRAAEAERASVKYKQVQFMLDKQGQKFDGIISGVTEWGLYVELEENKCEGMVRLRDIDDDFYVFDEDNFCITGNLSGVKYQLGDKVRVKVKRVDLDRKQIDFLMVLE